MQCSSLVTVAFLLVLRVWQVSQVGNTRPTMWLVSDLLCVMNPSAGSGKSTLAKRLEGRINGLPSLPSPICKAVGMDGYHYTRQQLDAFEDPVMAHKRRGAHFTFDAEAFGCGHQTDAVNINLPAGVTCVLGCLTDLCCRDCVRGLHGALSHPRLTMPSR